MMVERNSPRLWVLLGVLGLAAAVRLGVGSSTFGWPSGAGAAQIMALRLDRLLIAAVVGAALSVGGVALQALLRNPLAEPYILGLSTGAAAGMMAQWWLAASLGLWLGWGQGGAFLGAALSMGIVFVASRRGGVVDPLGLLLTGVVLSTINGALIMLMNHLAGPDLLGDNLARWMMGFIDESSGSITAMLSGQGRIPWAFLMTAGLLGASLAALLAQAQAMDVATLSDEEAQSLGINLPRMRLLLYTVASVLAAAAVLLAGPIAFVGLVCPHLGRAWLGSGHRDLLLGSAMLGAALVIPADACSAAIAVLLGVGIVPLGVLTAMVGGVAFLWMLRPYVGRGNPWQ